MPAENDTKVVIAENKPSEVTGKFEVINPGDDKFTITKVGILNHGSKTLDVLDKKVPPADQSTLKKIYDHHKSYAQLIRAPQGYKAPWQK